MENQITCELNLHIKFRFYYNVQLTPRPQYNTKKIQAHITVHIDVHGTVLTKSYKFFIANNSPSIQSQCPVIAKKQLTSEPQMKYVQ